MTPREQLVDVLKQSSKLRVAAEFITPKEPYIELLDLIESTPAMLARERREAFLEAAKLVCEWCSCNLPLKERPDRKGYFMHMDQTFSYSCYATDIHRKLAEEANGK